MIISNIFDTDLIADAVNLAMETSKAPAEDKKYSFTKNSPSQEGSITRALLATKIAHIWGNIGKTQEALSLNFATLRFLIQGGKAPFQEGSTKYDIIGVPVHERLLLIDRLLTAVDALLLNNNMLKQRTRCYLVHAIELFTTDDIELQIVLYWLVAYEALLNGNTYSFLENSLLLFTNERNEFLGTSKRVLAYKFLTIFQST